MPYLFAISEECQAFLEETGADLWEVGCRAAHTGDSTDLLGAALFLGLIFAAFCLGKAQGQI